MTTKLKQGDVVRYVECPRLRNRFPRPHLHLRPHSVNNTIGVILKTYDKAELWETELTEEQQKYFSRPTDEFNGYEWLCSADGTTYLIYEYETGEVKNDNTI